ncbi:MAG: D-alanine--D-alanine ligase [Treponema sp.]|jgi:D-alanine-D-alanine ligase|nr:D-alanine--D-alanine ligase [Treponema sp.]
MNIAILYGGKSSEHEVSVRSATAVVQNIDTKKHNVLLIGITKAGRWYLQSANEVQKVKSNKNETLSITQNQDMVVSIIPGGGTDGGLITVGSNFGAKNLPVDVAFPVLHGSYGEDGAIQGLFETANIPYVGGGVMSSAVSMDKEKTKQIWIHAGLPVVPFVCVRRYEYENEDLWQNIVKNVERDFTYPVFVKPCCAGSSVGASKAENKKELQDSVKEAFLWDDKILIEPFIEAREIECSVTGNTEFTAYTPGEVVSSHSFYDYDAKYNDPNGAQLLIPADLDDAHLRTVREISKKAYRVLDLTGLARVDFFLDKKTDNFYLNEINTIPGFTSISMFAKMCEASGLNYSELIEKLFELAIIRFKNRAVLKTSRA